MLIWSSSQYKKFRRSEKPSFWLNNYVVTDPSKAFQNKLSFVNVSYITKKYGPKSIRFRTDFRIKVCIFQYLFLFFVPFLLNYLQDLCGQFFSSEFQVIVTPPTLFFEFFFLVGFRKLPLFSFVNVAFLFMLHQTIVKRRYTLNPFYTHDT